MANKEQAVNLLIRYGAVVVLVCAVVNIHAVLRNFELSRAAAKVENQAQAAEAQRRAFEGVLREFATRANSDTVIQQIFARHQTPAAAK
jgi:hypothetical protein